jgi:signal peptidase I
MLHVSMKAARLIAQPIVIALVLALGVRSAVRIYSIPSGSMEPTLQVGDHIVVTAYHSELPRRGDVVVFHSPVDPAELLVKRITGVAGDLVEGRNGQLIVPAGCYFVLGDNRANSFDSRQWGVLSRNLIVGRARLVLWSSSVATLEPRANASPRWRTALPSHSIRIDRLFKPIE